MARAPVMRQKREDHLHRGLSTGKTMVHTRLLRSSRVLPTHLTYFTQGMKASAPRREAEYDQKAALKEVGPAWVLPALRKWTIFVYLVIRNILDTW